MEEARPGQARRDESRRGQCLTLLQLVKRATPRHATRGTERKSWLGLAWLLELALSWDAFFTSPTCGLAGWLAGCLAPLFFVETNRRQTRLKAITAGLGCVRSRIWSFFF